MPSFNKIIIVGYIGRDAQLQSGDDGTSMCVFPVATNERHKGAGPRAGQRTTWFRVCIGGQQAAYLAARLTKGMQVYLEGRVSQREYSDRSGARRVGIDLRATDLQVLSATTEDIIPRISDEAQEEQPVAASHHVEDDREFDDDLLPL